MGHIMLQLDKFEDTASGTIIATNGNSGYLIMIAVPISDSIFYVYNDWSIDIALFFSFDDAISFFDQRNPNHVW
jgi:hypothetical protein